MTLRTGEAGADMVARMFGYIPFTPIWNITGQPAISLPLHMTPAGLPLGVMFVAAYGREDLLFRLAAQLEEASPWRDRRPPISASVA
jgi:amidase